MKKLYIVISAGVFLFLGNAVGEVPGVISHQGRLTVSGTNYTGLCQFKFALVDSTGSLTFWSHDGTCTAGAEPTGAPVVLQVTRGVFSVNLGDGTIPGMAQSIPAHIFTNSEVYLRIWVGDGSSTSQRLSPDRRITAAPYALTAGMIAGPVRREQLPVDVSLLGSDQIFTGRNTFTGVTDLGNPANRVAGRFTGDGSAITNLDGNCVRGPVAQARDFAGSLMGEVTGTQGATVVSSIGGLAASTVVFGTMAAVQAESANSPNRLVQRDSAGGFAAGMITASFAGDGSALTNLNGESVTGTVARATSFSGPLAGDVTGSQTATVVSSLAGIPVTTVAVGVQAANSASSASIPSAIVRRDTAGGFAAGTITASFTGDGSGLTNLNGGSVTGTVARATSFSGPLAGDVTGSQTATVVSSLAGIPVTTVAVGVQAANSASSASIPSAIVRRDTAGGFSAGTIAGTFEGDGSGVTNLNSAHLTGSLSPALLEPALPAGTLLVSMSAQDSTLVSKGYRLAMSVPAPAWVSATSVNAPSARSGHTAVWEGRRLIVWGGTLAPGIDLNSGGMWHPDTDAWETVSSVNAPLARSGHTAVWTGTDMLVWGGKSSGGWLRSGGAFRPESQLWATLPLANCPAERSGHIAIWTGTRMLVWGGQNDDGLLDDGALYDPVRNEWTPLLLPNPPEARIDATAVWAGDRLLIWGGQGAGGVVLQSGAQLVFSGELPIKWTPTATVTAPVARRWHTAIWTGDRMIVWGGENAGPLNDGAVYDPFADSWQPMPVVAAPTARFHHISLWTGQEMLVLGGSNGSLELTSGSAFDPLTEVWRPLSLSGNPQPRSRAVGAWSGTELLVFGGVANGQTLAALQRLVPQPVWYFYRKL